MQRPSFDALEATESEQLGTRSEAASRAPRSTRNERQLAFITSEQRNYPVTFSDIRVPDNEAFDLIVSGTGHGLPLEPLTRVDRLAKSYVISVLDIRPERKTTRQPGDAYAKWADKLAYIHGGRFTFDRGIRGQNHLCHRSASHAGEQLRNLELIRTYTSCRIQ